MSSPRRHNGRPTRTLMLGCATMLLLGTAAHAADRRFVLSAFSNVPGGRALLAGDYDTAMSQLSRVRISSRDEGGMSTNRCVALTVTRQWQKARVACDEAVQDADRERLDLPSWMSGTHQEQDNYLAIAYSNRAVLKWLSDDAASAAQDLKRAQHLAPGAGFVTRNLAALTVHSSVAQVSIGPQS